MIATLNNEIIFGIHFAWGCVCVCILSKRKNNRPAQSNIRTQRVLIWSLKGEILSTSAIWIECCFVSFLNQQRLLIKSFQTIRFRQSNQHPWPFQQTPVKFFALCSPSHSGKFSIAWKNKIIFQIEAIIQIISKCWPL